MKCTRRLDRLNELLLPGFFRSLGDPNRLALLIKLARSCQPSTVSELAACLKVDVSVASRHLAMLRDAGILEAEKRGKAVRYTVDHARLAGTLRQIAGAIERCCPPGGKSRTRSRRRSES